MSFIQPIINPCFPGHFSVKGIPEPFDELFTDLGGFKNVDGWVFNNKEEPVLHKILEDKVFVSCENCDFGEWIPLIIANKIEGEFCHNYSNNKCPISFWSKLKIVYDPVAMLSGVINEL